MYKKVVCDGYIAVAGEINNGEPITAEEYRAIIDAFSTRPVPEAGYTYRLKADTLEWELVELPPVPEPDPEAEIYDYEQELADLGVRFE